MDERREYERLITDIECVVFAPEEYCGRIINISENGACIAIEGESSIKVGSSLTVQFVDDAYGKNFSVQVRALVVRKIEESNECGCYLHTSLEDDMYKYVVIKKLEEKYKRKAEK